MMTKHTLQKYQSGSSNCITVVPTVSPLNFEQLKTIVLQTPTQPLCTDYHQPHQTSRHLWSGWLRLRSRSGSACLASLRELILWCSVRAAVWCVFPRDPRLSRLPASTPETIGSRVAACKNCIAGLFCWTTSGLRFRQCLTAAN